MKRLIALLVLLGATAVYAQPVPPGGLRKVTTDDTLVGNGTIGSPLGMLHCISDGDGLVWNATASTWDCGPGAGITNSAGANVIMKSDGTNAVASDITDDGSTVVASKRIAATVSAGTAGVIIGHASKSWTIIPATSDLQLFEYTSTYGVGGGNTRATFTSGGGFKSFGRITSTASSGGAAVDLDNTNATGHRWQLNSLDTGQYNLIDATLSAARLTIDTSGNVAIPGGTLSMNSHQIHNVTDGSSAQDAATVAQLTAATTGANQVTGTLTSGMIPVATGANTVGDSSIKDDGTSVKINTNKLVITESTGSAVSSGFFQGNGGIYAGSNSQVYLTKGTGKEGLGCFFATNGTATCKINPVGYAEGQTQFRDLDIEDGKGNSAVYITGSTLGTEFKGAVTADSTLGVAGLVDFTGQSVYLGRQVLTSTTTATYTPTTGTRKVLLRMCGAGGGSGGAKAAAAGGGAGGSYIEKWINPGAAITGGSYADGVGGTAGTATPTDGGTGGDTTITIQGTTYTAKGGLKSLAAGTSGAQPGGAGQGGSSAGDVSSLGMPGNMGVATTSNLGVSGNGGSSPFGTGGVGVQFSSNNVPGVAGSGYCSGASGGAGNSGAAGAAGAQGVIIIDEWR